MTRITSSHRELLRHVLAAMGMGSAIVAGSACGGSTADPPADAAVPPAKDDASTDDTANVDTSITPMDSLITIDMGRIGPPDVDVDAGIHCRKLVVSVDSFPQQGCPGEDAGRTGDPRLGWVRTCLPPPPEGQSCSDAYDLSCTLNAYICGLSHFGWNVRCAFNDAERNCCYIIEGSCPVGRPFIVEGVARRAYALGDASWAKTPDGASRASAAPVPDVESLDPATRAALADVWTQDALAEHASIASFSRFVLQCLAVGAPADIVEGAQRACADEIEHARIAFRFASAYAGRPVGPGPLDVTGALDRELDPTAIACSVASEGCIAELVSANFIAAARDQATDPAVRATLARIAEQEMNHALLAWRYLAWACENGDAALRVRLARVFERMNEHVGFGATTALSGDTAALRAHGYLTVDERRAIAVSVLEQVVRPAARALLDAAREGTADHRHIV